MIKGSGEEKGLIRSKPEDPNRCQNTTNAFGQCGFLAYPGSTYCKMHGGSTAVQIQQNKRITSGYRLAQWEVRVDELASSDGIKTLRDEIGITRMTLEALVTKCQDQTDLMLYAPRISDMVMKIEKLVTSCNRLETATGMLLDKAAALTLAGKMVEIISRHVTDPNAINIIASEIGSVILGESNADTG